ncbi:hypothetical protein CDAR_570131 [Caerostris darwini]|uniref:Uncharacterized protein n=1 Tax=Caerostris darwini TaxID=1538125 RepID=A0AAV4S0F0_9ARAC|nr:hypothetical protein CDAR_570131 [Caerostris darwini]
MASHTLCHYLLHLCRGKCSPSHNSFRQRGFVLLLTGLVCVGGGIVEENHLLVLLRVQISGAIRDNLVVDFSAVIFDFDECFVSWRWHLRYIYLIWSIFLAISCETG